jgi:hypothetical protein
LIWWLAAFNLDPTMSVSKRHHYTPRYYLKRFENAEGALWRLDQDRAAVALGNNERFGYKNHWNTLRNPPPGYPPDWAEQRIAEIDGLASAEINRILAGDFSTDLGALAFAIALMTHNNPRVMRDLDENHADKVAHWSADFRLIVKLKTAMDTWRDYVPVHYAVQVIDSEDCDLRFLTSSNPLIDFSNKPTKLLPLSSRHCLFLSWDSRHRAFARRFVRCDRETVAEINKLTVRNAWQYVYSCTPDFDGYENEVSCTINSKHSNISHEHDCPAILEDLAPVSLDTGDCDMTNLTEDALESLMNQIHDLHVRPLAQVITQTLALLVKKDTLTKDEARFAIANAIGIITATTWSTDAKEDAARMLGDMLSVIDSL